MLGPPKVVRPSHHRNQTRSLQMVVNFGLQSCRSAHKNAPVSSALSGLKHKSGFFANRICLKVFVVSCKQRHHSKLSKNDQSHAPFSSNDLAKLSLCTSGKRLKIRGCKSVSILLCHEVSCMRLQGFEQAKISTCAGKATAKIDVITFWSVTNCMAPQRDSLQSSQNVYDSEPLAQSERVLQTSHENSMLLLSSAIYDEFQELKSLHPFFFEQGLDASLMSQQSYLSISCRRSCSFDDSEMGLPGNQ